MRPSSDQYFMALAKIASTRSGCNSRPTGAVIVKDKRVISTGYNGSIAGENQCTDYGKEFCFRRFRKQDDKGEGKYSECKSIHAEQNAINQVASIGGFSLKDAIIYCSLFPCLGCLKNIASVGIKEVVYEMIYESTDKERDAFWFSQVKNYNIRIRQLVLTESNKQTLVNSILNTTSLRRLE
jgi:dCMP deaminase